MPPAIITFYLVFIAGSFLRVLLPIQCSSGFGFIVVDYILLIIFSRFSEFQWVTQNKDGFDRVFNVLDRVLPGLRMNV